MITGVPNSKSPDDTVIKAIELTARLKGLLNDKQNTTNIIVTPILNGTSTRVIEGNTT